MKYCSNCGSSRIHKSGKTKKGTQRYYCHDCGQRHTENPKKIFKNINIKCPHCESKEIIKKGFTRNGNQRYFCKSCNKKFVIKYPAYVSVEDKKIILKYHLYCGVSIQNLAKELHHGQSTIRKIINNYKEKLYQEAK